MKLTKTINSVSDLRAVPDNDNFSVSLNSGRPFILVISASGMMLTTRR